MKLVKHIKSITFPTLICFSFVINGCKKDNKIPETTNSNGTQTISGKVQKGPYKNGATLIAYELNNSLGQTGKSFSSTIVDDLGDFSLNNINLNSQYILIAANGYYYNEHFNNASEGQLYLETFADINSNSSININLLTHIIKPRTEHLIAQGSNYSNAVDQAQNEFSQIMGVPSAIASNYNSMELSSSSFLFAMSLLFQRHSSAYQNGFNYTAELSSLLSNFRNDFSNNGLIDNQKIIDTLLYNSVRIDLIDVKQNIKNYYAGLGITITPPNFEQYIYLFQKKYSSIIYQTPLFLDSALLITDATPYSNMENVLSKTKTYFQGSNPRTISVTLPCDSAFTIQFTKLGTGGFFGLGFPNFGWNVGSQNSSAFTLNAERKNVPLGILLYLNGQDSAQIDYYSNNSSIPYFSKVIHWTP